MEILEIYHAESTIRIHVKDFRFLIKKFKKSNISHLN